MRIMRLLMMFDLPTKTKADKDNYIKFKRFLDDDGYQREQNSVYSRNLLSRASSESHADQLRKHLPPAGHVVAKELGSSPSLSLSGLQGSCINCEVTLTVNGKSKTFVPKAICNGKVSDGIYVRPRIG